MSDKDFFSKVYDLVKTIPVGKVSTYGIIAEKIGNRKKARHVGFALNAVVNTDIPCHRVVNRNGELSGSLHFATPTLIYEFLGFLTRGKMRGF